MAFSFGSIKRFLLGSQRNPNDPEIFHKLTLMAFFAWVGLGSDGLSSSCYGPSEVAISLGGHLHLSIFVAIASAITIFVISTSYSQIIELFPNGGGGYLVASKLISPYVGMISGSALLIDYVLTITVSIASGADAIFSFLPISLQFLKLPFGLFILMILTVLNMRGVKESVLPLVPIFLIFVFSHLFIISYAIITHFFNLPTVVSETSLELGKTTSQLGIFGTFLLIIHAYSMGAGTYTGIEAVSNGIPILKEPKVHTARKTMIYMATSLTITVFGLLLAYVLYMVEIEPGKTMNAVLFAKATSGWNPVISNIFIVITLISEGAILFVAAQTGFLDGPRVLSNMAIDRWIPTRFASLNDRLVTQNGILVMGIGAFILMFLTNGNVTFLVVLYSINVFITFVLSQLGMVLHWWQVRRKEKHWGKKFIINGFGMLLSAFILCSVTIVKFNEGGWITILITGSVIGFVTLIKKHYIKTGKQLEKFNNLIGPELLKQDLALLDDKPRIETQYDPKSRTAALLVNGFSGLGIHSLMTIIRLFKDNFKNFIFIEVGVIDAGTFKGTEELESLKIKVDEDINSYVNFMQSHGYWAEGFSSTGLDVVEEINKMLPNILKKYKEPIFFGGQIVFPDETGFSRLLHNYTLFAVQRQLYNKGLHFIILPTKI